MRKGGFSLEGIVALLCASEYGHISKTHIHSDQYDLLFINTRVRGKKTALWNQTLPFLLCQPTIWRAALGNANILDKTHKHTHTRASTQAQQNLPGHIVYRQNNSLCQRIRCNNLRDGRWFSSFQLGIKVQSIICCVLVETETQVGHFF